MQKHKVILGRGRGRAWLKWHERILLNRRVFITSFSKAQSIPETFSAGKFRLLTKSKFILVVFHLLDRLSIKIHKHRVARKRISLPVVGSRMNCLLNPSNHYWGLKGKNSFHDIYELKFMLLTQSWGLSFVFSFLIQTGSRQIFIPIHDIEHVCFPSSYDKSQWKHTKDF